MSIIRFEQLSFIKNEKEKIEEYQNRINYIQQLFVKNTLLQLLAFHLWDDIIDLSTAYYDKDYSKFLLKKSEDLFFQFEELQSQVEQINAEKLAEHIKAYNVRTKK